MKLINKRIKYITRNNLIKVLFKSYSTNTNLTTKTLNTSVAIFDEDFDIERLELGDLVTKELSSKIPFGAISIINRDINNKIDYIEILDLYNVNKFREDTYVPAYYYAKGNLSIYLYKEKELILSSEEKIKAISLLTDEVNIGNIWKFNREYPRRNVSIEENVSTFIFNSFQDGTLSEEKLKRFLKEAFNFAMGQYTKLDMGIDMPIADLANEISYVGLDISDETSFSDVSKQHEKKTRFY